MGMCEGASNRSPDFTTMGQCPQVLKFWDPTLILLNTSIPFLVRWSHFFVSLALVCHIQGQTLPSGHNCLNNII